MYIDSALNILSDARPTAVRQGLAALKDIILFKPDLRNIVCSAASKINYLKYKDTMHSLIAKDIRDLLALVKSMNT